MAVRGQPLRARRCKRTSEATQPRRLIRRVEETERRVAHLAYDLHDGPLQCVAALGGELELFRAQLAEVLEGHEFREHVLGRVGDLTARLLALEEELRQLACSFESPSLPDAPLRTAVQHEVDAFRRETGIDATFEVDGDLERLTPTERVAVLRCMQSALANVRQHSGAAKVEVEVGCSRRRASVVIRDDGRGFDVESALLGAVARGRLGLLGMGERARSLSGHLEIRSSPGGPTEVEVTWPMNEPVPATEEVRASVA